MYANPVPWTSTALTDYYNALGITAGQYVADNIATMDQSNVDRIVNVIKAEADMMDTAGFAALQACVCENNLACGSRQWFLDWFPRISKILIAQHKSGKLSTDKLYQMLLGETNFIILFEKQLGPLYNYLLSLQAYQTLSNPILIQSRALPPYLRTGLDLIVLNFILGNTLTAIPLNSDGSYSINMGERANLYYTGIQNYYMACLKNSAADNFVIVVVMADRANKARCA